MPRRIQEEFHFTFLIRDPHYSVPSYFRCTIPPLDEVTGFYSYDPLEAGYDELRRHFDYLRHEGLIGPRVATRPDLSPAEECEGNATVHEICVVDADDMLDAPAKTIEAFCRSVDMPYKEEMLSWDTEEDHAFACWAFEKWRGFHNDAIESKGLEAREHVSFVLSGRTASRRVWANLGLSSRIPSSPRKSSTPSGRRSTARRLPGSFARRSTTTWPTICI